MRYRQTTIGISGLGLIGGSLAAAMGKYVSTVKVVGYDIDREVAEKALRRGLISTAEVTFDKFVNSCHLIFLATPVSTILDQIKLLHSYTQPLIVTDVGSVKSPVMKAAETLPGNIVFVGGHPMAGSQKVGIENANPDLFRNAAYVLCPPPTAQIPRELTKLIESVGARQITMPPDEHDRVVSVISHVPQLLSVALLNEAMLRNSTRVLELAAGGFRDMTRIGSSPYEIWKDILSHNRKNIARDIELLISRLQEYRENLIGDEENYFATEFSRARNFREILETRGESVS